MAIDNLNYYSAGLPAGQQTDRYSSQPGCLRSKNLDIFSSSKSVKATAFSQPVNTDLSGVVLVDQTGNLILKNDNVYDISSGSEVLVYTGVSANFPSYKVSYNGKTGTYEDAQRGTPRQLISKYENGVLKYFTLFTDRARLSYSTVAYNTPDEVRDSAEWVETSSGSFKKQSGTKRSRIRLKLPNIKGFSSANLFINAQNSSYSTQGTLQIYQIYLNKEKYRYNAETDQIEDRGLENTYTVPITDQLDLPTKGSAENVIPLIPDPGDYYLEIWFEVIPPAGSTDYTWSSGIVDMRVSNYDYYYSYLPINAERELKPISEYYWEKKTSFQLLYNWGEEWANGDHSSRVVRYNLEEYMGWANDVSMDVVGLTVWNEQVYMIGNMNGNGYIIPCDLAGGRGTPYIAYGCTFRGATNIDYLMYLVGEDRGISTLWAYNGQELVQVIGGNKEKATSDVVDNDEQYKFDGKIVNWRKNLILTTEDNRLFQYGQTYGGKGGAFIHQLPTNAVITGLKTVGNDLEVDYSITVNDTTTKYKITYQDDIATKNYNTEWEAVYPIVLGNHILEKEESDLYCSYILPSSSTKLEFWGMANHYHFWTFTSADNPTLSESENYKIKGTSGTYALKFIEKNDNQYTFRLEGDLPVQTTNEMQIIDSNNTVVINYSDYNHFRKIGAIETDKYLEGEFRFHNLNNKLELPKSHSLQIMVKGKGTANYTPELFSVDLVANQRERG